MLDLQTFLLKDLTYVFGISLLWWDFKFLLSSTRKQRRSEQDCCKFQKSSNNLNKEVWDHVASLWQEKKKEEEEEAMIGPIQLFY